MMKRSSWRIGIHVPREMCNMPMMLMSSGWIPSSSPSFQLSLNFFGSRSPSYSAHTMAAARPIVHISKTNPPKAKKKRDKGRAVDSLRDSPDTDGECPARPARRGDTS